MIYDIFYNYVCCAYQNLQFSVESFNLYNILYYLLTSFHVVRKKENGRKSCHSIIIIIASTLSCCKIFNLYTLFNKKKKKICVCVPCV